MVFDSFFNWRDPDITDWKKVLRIVYTHGWQKEIDCRGFTAMQNAHRVLEKHEKELKEDEKEYLKGLLK